MENVYELPCQLLSCAKKMLKRNDKILLYEQGGRKWDKLWTHVHTYLCAHARGWACSYSSRICDLSTCV